MQHLECDQHIWNSVPGSETSQFQEHVLARESHCSMHNFCLIHILPPLFLFDTSSISSFANNDFKCIFACTTQFNVGYFLGSIFRIAIPVPAHLTHVLDTVNPFLTNGTASSSWILQQYKLSTFFKALPKRNAENGLQIPREARPIFTKSM